MTLSRAPAPACSPMASARWTCRRQAPPMTDASTSPDRRGRRSFTEVLGAVLEEARPGYARFRVPVVEAVSGGVAGGLHGGAVCTLVDIVAIGAVKSLVGPDEHMAGTAELSVSYLRPA